MTITENIVIEEARAEYVSVPAEIEWVEGYTKGFTRHIIDTSGLQTHSRKYLYQEASNKLVMVSPTYAEDGTLVRPAMVTARVIPAIYKTNDIKTWHSAGPAMYRAVPYEYKDGKTGVPISQPKTIEKIHPAVIKQIEIKKLEQSPTYIIRDKSGQVLHKFQTVTAVSTFLKSFKTP